MTWPEVQKQENQERCREFVEFVQEATADGLGTFVAYNYDGWLVMATWDGSAPNEALRDLIAEHGGMPQTVPVRP